jgi:hypothetical protein
MFTFTSRRFSQAAILAALILAGAGTLFTASVEPAHAECKLGGPHCITTGRTPIPNVGGVAVPGTGWQDVDCAEFGNCNSSELKGTEIRRPPSGQLHANIQNNGLKRR